MPTYITPQYVARNWPKRLKKAHKGAGGKLLVIGGSIEYYGSPILVGLAALHTGTDLVYLYVPTCNFDVTRKPYPDFIVKKYTGNYFSLAAAKAILPFANKCDAVVLGPGLGRKSEKAIRYFVDHYQKPLVLDADAILPYKKLRSTIVITPHAGEFKRLTSEIVPQSVTAKQALVSKWAKRLGTIILLKTDVGVIGSENGKVVLNKTGNEGMTVGGTGDVLAGVVGSLLAKHVDSFTAAKLAAYTVGAAGDRLYNRISIGFKASDVAQELASTIHNLLKRYA